MKNLSFENSGTVIGTFKRKNGTTFDVEFNGTPYSGLVASTVRVDKLIPPDSVGPLLDSVKRINMELPVPGRIQVQNLGLVEISVGPVQETRSGYSYRRPTNTPDLSHVIVTHEIYTSTDKAGTDPLHRASFHSKGLKLLGRLFE